MSEDWDAIQAEVADALADFDYPCTIIRASDEEDEPQTPWDEPADPPNEPQKFLVYAVKSIREVRDRDGTLIGEARRKVKIGAGGVVPLKSDRIVLGLAPEDVTGDTPTKEILSVHTQEPTHVPPYHDLYLAI